MDHIDAATADVILVDRYGVLADLYALADVAFVGGGFHTLGLHSLPEPAAFGAPVMFGPIHGKSRDASVLLAADGARPVSDADAIERAIVGWFEDAASRRRMGDNARDAIRRGTGAAARSLAIVERLLSA